MSGKREKKASYEAVAMFIMRVHEVVGDIDALDVSANSVGMSESIVELIADARIALESALEELDAL